ncbi:MAG: tyrosine--tRNA ligase [Nocardioidaceae bacterium]|nr:tyrosine--tRNA ligase [Nocardioidaceae bacterium]
MDPHVLADLEWRGLIAHSTDLDALRADMSAGPITVYCGFDPTAPSLHMGNLLQLLTLRRLQVAGHKPIGIVGGATGMIGDPKAAGERKLNPPETVQQWSDNLREQLSRFWSFDGDNAALVVNNCDWTSSMSTIEFLRDVGKHFPVNRMLARDVVRSRLEAGISYTEFSYVLLQSMDYLELFRRYGCSMQTGGSDQWGNITAGVELIRRVEGARVHALATPLVTKADGTKFGKTESGSVWLDASMTSPYAFHQFWLNTDDRDVVALLRYFTFRSRDDIEELERLVSERPQSRAAQRALADDVTSLTHGAEQTEKVKTAAVALFGSGDLGELDADTLDSALQETPHAEVPLGDELPLYIDLLVATQLAPSRGAARRTVQEGGAYVNNVRISGVDQRLSRDEALGGGWFVLRRGKKQLAGIRLV